MKLLQQAKGEAERLIVDVVHDFAVYEVKDKVSREVLHRVYNALNWRWRKVKLFERSLDGDLLGEDVKYHMGTSPSSLVLRDLLISTVRRSELMSTVHSVQVSNNPETKRVEDIRDAIRLQMKEMDWYA